MSSTYPSLAPFHCPQMHTRNCGGGGTVLLLTQMILSGGIAPHNSTKTQSLRTYRQYYRIDAILSR